MASRRQYGSGFKIGRNRARMTGFGAEGAPYPLSIGTPLHGYVPDYERTSGGGTISIIQDLVGSIDLVQVTGGQQPAEALVNGRVVAAFSHLHTMLAETLTDLNHASGFTVSLGVEILTRTGTPATSDAVFDLRNAGATEITRLEAGNTSTFLSNLNQTGTGFPDLDGISSDLVGQGMQHLQITLDGAGDTVNGWLNNEIMKTLAGQTGDHDADVDLTLGSNLSFRFAYLFIHQGKLTTAEATSIANWGARYGSTPIADKYAGKVTVAPSFTGTEQVGQVLSGVAATYVLPYNQSPSLSHQWYNNTDDGNATGTGNATIDYTIAAADEGDTLKRIETESNSGLVTDTANTGAIAAASTFVPTDLADLQGWWDASDEATITDTGGTVSQWDDKSAAGNDFVTVNGDPQTGDAGNDINSRNVIYFDGTGDYLNWPDIAIASGGALHIFFVIGDLTISDSSDHLFTLWDGGKGMRCQSGNGAVSFFGTLGTIGSLFTGVGPGASALSNPGLVELELDPTANTGTLRFNGTQVLQTTDYGTGGNTDFGTLVQGEVMAANAGGNAMEGALCEVVLCDAVLSGADLTDLRSYLSSKWGIV